MFDEHLRGLLGPTTDRVGRWLHNRSIGAMPVTLGGLALGLAASALAANENWIAALVVFLASRVLDGLDGAVARVAGPSPAGGFTDLIADFTVYAGFIVGVAYALPEARLAAVALLSTYYLSAGAFLLWGSLSAANPSPDGLGIDDNRSVRFVGGLAEGFETIVAYSLICLLPDSAELILWIFAAVVALTAVQRVAFALRNLRDL